MAIDITALVTQFGQYYEKGDQNMNRLLEQLRKPVEFESIMTPVTTDQTTYKASETTVGELLQGWQKAWTPKGDAAFVPIQHDLKKAKVNIEIHPHDISYSWAGFLEGKSDVDVRNWPLVRWLMEKKYAPQLREDLEQKAMFHGEYVAPTPGTPGDAIEVMDGVNKERKIASAAGRLGTIAVGAPPVSPVDYVDYVKEFVKELSSQYRKRNYTIAMSADNELKYRDGFLEKYGANFSVNAMDNAKIMNLPITIKGFDAMEGSEVLFVTPKENLISLKRAKQNEGSWKVETLKGEVYVFTHFYRKVGFNIPEIMFTNNVELV